MKIEGYLTLREGLDYASAMRLARREQEADRKLRAMGLKGNWGEVKVLVTFERPSGRKEYGVFAVPTYIHDSFPGDAI